MTDPNPIFAYVTIAIAFLVFGGPIACYIETGYHAIIRKFSR